MRRLTTALLGCALVLLVAVAPAQAAFGLKDLDVTFSNQNGTAATKAGTHPFEMTTTLGVNTKVVSEAAEDPETSEPVDGEVPEGEVRDLTIAQIPGFVGDQTAVPQCTQADFATRSEGYAACPDASAVGVAAVKGEFNVFPVGEEVALHLPIYNLVPPPGVAAEFGFVAANVPVTFDVGISESPPYNLVVRLRNIPQALLFYSSEVTLWGNPANPAHDSLRGECVGSPVEPTAEPISSGECSVNGSVAERPLLTLPRSCHGPLDTLFAATSWQGAFSSGSARTHNAAEPPQQIGMTDCGLLPFGPQIEAQPTAASAESPTGLDFSIDVDDKGLVSPTGTANADIAKVEARLPVGVTANPSAAEGLGVCTKAQYQVASLTVPGCPESSKLGSVQVTSPLLEKPLSGSLFLAQQDDPATAEHGAENPFDSLLALYILIRSPEYGVFIKQAGKVEPDPRTGQLVSTFEGIPELPFSRFRLHFREGPRAPLVTPPTCGTYTTQATLTPSSGGAPIPATSTFKVNSGPGGGPCPVAGPLPFSPGFQAGTLNNNAGSYSPFQMRITRRDGEQDITRFSSVLPQGVVGKIAGVSRCSDAAIATAKTKTGRQELASPSCPANSRIGRVLVGAGVGSALTYVPGTIYLAGPFNGDPLSVVVITPAVAGPFDVGTVVTREALTLDPTTAEVQVDGSASDPIPHILKGIPLKVRDLRVYIDREDFTLNATSCDEESVQATLSGSGLDVFNPADDLAVGVQDRYQAANCSSLGFKPSLKLRLKGSTNVSGHPKLHSVVTYPKGSGYANIGRAMVILPHSEFIDPERVSNPCTRPDFAAGKCPPASRLGYAKAWTPLLDEPLKGPVYFRSNGGVRDLPDIVADLNGPFHIVLVGAVDSVLPKRNPEASRLRTSFANVPDAPVSRFVLNLKGGKEGVIENSQNLCKGKRFVRVRLRGHNNRRHNFKTKLRVNCKKKRKQRQSRHARRG